MKNKNKAKEKQQKQIEQPGYQFREIICPYCQHRFMYGAVPDACSCHYIYEDEVTGEMYDSAVCPMCSSMMAVIPHVLEGCNPGITNLKQIGVRGI